MWCGGVGDMGEGGGRELGVLGGGWGSERCGREINYSSFLKKKKALGFHFYFELSIENGG